MRVTSGQTPISIHALREESDISVMAVGIQCNAFQSTLSVRRATRDTLTVLGYVQISIHALREESDPCFEQSVILLHISIHALREESDSPDPHAQSNTQSISIHALREESDVAASDGTCLIGISIHALREESDLKPSWPQTRPHRFQSTLSVRRATRGIKGLR